MVRKSDIFCSAKKGADHTKQMGSERTTLPWSTSTKRCALNQSPPQSKSWQGKPVEASLAGHSGLLALCFLVQSQMGH